MMKEVVLKSVKFMFWNNSYIFLLKQASNYFVEKMQETKLRKSRNDQNVMEATFSSEDLLTCPIVMLALKPFSWSSSSSCISGMGGI